MTEAATEASTHLDLYVESVCRTRNERMYGGYGLTAPLHHLRISEPLPGQTQTADKAELASLHAALEYISGSRVRTATVHIRPSTTVREFESQPSDLLSADLERPPARHKRLWQSVRTLRHILTDRGVSVTVTTLRRKSTMQMLLAYKLAKHGTSLHVVCPLCEQTHGRQWLTHVCRPLCRRGACNNVRFASTDDYSQHVFDNHAHGCRRHDCTFVTIDAADLRSHVRERHAGFAHECHICARPFRCSIALKRHLRTCVPPHVCAHCDAAFASVADLRAHAPTCARGRQAQEPLPPWAGGSQRPNHDVGVGDSDGEDDEDYYSDSDLATVSGESALQESSSEEEDDGRDDEEQVGDEGSGGLPRLVTDGYGREWEVDDSGALRSGTSNTERRARFLASGAFDRHSQ